MSDDELKPCPFCGGKAETRYNSRYEAWGVECWTISCAASIDVEETEEAAIAAWNRRAAPAEERREP